MMGKEFKKFCLENIGVIRELKILPVITGSNKEAVLFTYSAEPHLEFLITIRNKRKKVLRAPADLISLSYPNGGMRSLFLL